MAENLKELLRAKKVNPQKINDGVFVLTTNSPKLIDKDDNEHIALIHEFHKNEKVDEKLYIHSTFNDDSFAIIANEFYLNFLENSKKVDFSYYYFSEDNKVTVYLYDIKKTFSDDKVVLHLIEQWKNSIRTAQYCIDELKDYEKECEISAIYIGVITENNDVECRKKTIEQILEVKKNPDTLDRLPLSIKKRFLAKNYAKIQLEKILEGFLDGKVKILGTTYEYDVRKFDKNKDCHIYFNNGVINKETLI